MTEIERLRQCAIKVSDLTEQIEETEALLKALKANRQRLANKVMLDLMLDCGLDEFKSRNTKFAIKEYVSGSIPKDTHDAMMAYAWLEENGAGELIKNMITVNFSKGDNDRAIEAVEILKDLGCSPKRKKGVHPMTLKKFAKDRLENGQPINLDILGLTAGQVVNIKRL